MEPHERYSIERYSNRFIGFRYIVVTWMVVLSIAVGTEIEAWSFSDMPVRHSTHRFTSQINSDGYNRRDFMAAASLLMGTGPFLWDAKRANAAEDGADPKQRFVAARKELRELIDNYSDITEKGGGDAVRNKLGTQGVKSNLFGIQKVLKSLTADAEDIVEYTEAMEEFNAYYFQAEGAAYQSLFVEHSSAKGTPESFLKTAKADIMQMEKYMDQLAVQLKL